MNRSYKLKIVWKLIHHLANFYEAWNIIIYIGDIFLLYYIIYFIIFIILLILLFFAEFKNQYFIKTLRKWDISNVFKVLWNLRHIILWEMLGFNVPTIKYGIWWMNRILNTSVDALHGFLGFIWRDLSMLMYFR